MFKMSYIQPEQVISPKQYWVLIAVLDPGTEGKTALAIGRWDNELRLGMRWNGNSDNPVGNPQSRGVPTWFIVEEKYYPAILGSGLVSAAGLEMARMFLPALLAPRERNDNDRRLMDFYRHREPMTNILNDMLANGGKQQYDPNSMSAPHRHLVDMQTMRLIEKVTDAEEATYQITAFGREQVEQ